MFIRGQSARPEIEAMPFGLLLALTAFAQAANAAPAPATPAPPAAHPAAPATAGRPAGDPCRTPPPATTSRTIVVCAQKPEGYRLDPDVMEARKEARNHTGGPRPRETFKDNPCATVGPMGCRGNAGIDLVSAAAVLGQMAARASRGENVGEMFETEPQPSEYQLYVAAKKRREAKEAEAAAKAAKARAAQAQPLPNPDAPTATPNPSH